MTGAEPAPGRSAGSWGEGARGRAARIGLACAGALLIGATAHGARPPARDSLPRDPIEVGRALDCFAEMKAASAREAGRTWGRPLDGPMMFVEPSSRFVVASRPDPRGRLVPRGGAYVGTLPDTVPAANTAVRWEGVTWTLLDWPLPEERDERVALMAHECWHRIQGEIGLAGTDPACGHLDTLEGRYWIELEWAALRRALLANGEARTRAIGDAMLFRAHRRGLFPDGVAAERALEMNEGLAQYTGMKVGFGDTDSARRRIATDLISAAGRESFVRSFAYLSGPAYGYLLDGLAPGWRRGLRPGADLGDLLARAAGLAAVVPDTASARERARSYDPGPLRRFEEERERTRRERVAVWRQRLVDGPVLQIPLVAFHYGFDPNGLVPLEGVGTVYPTLTVSDVWGRIEVTGGGLITSDFTRLLVTAPASPEGTTIHGDGWTLELAAGWRLRPAARAGGWVLDRER